MLDAGETPLDARARVQAAKVTSKAIEKCGGAPGFRPNGYHTTWLDRAIRWRQSVHSNTQGLL